MKKWIIACNKVHFGEPDQVVEQVVAERACCGDQFEHFEWQLQLVIFDYIVELLYLIKKE